MGMIEATWRLKRPVPSLARPALLAAFVVASAVVALVVLQLSGSSTDGPMASAYAATSDLQSYRASVSVTKTFAPSGKTYQGSYGLAFVAPDRYELGFTEKGAADYIIVGDEHYTRYVGKELSDPSMDLIGTIPSREATLELLDSLPDLVVLPNETIDGVDTLHFQSRIDQFYAEKYLTEKVGERQAVGSEAYVELWINEKDYYVRQMKTAFLVLSEPKFEWLGHLSVVRVVRFFDVNAPMAIEPPLTPSGDPEPEWTLVPTGQGQTPVLSAKSKPQPKKSASSK